jgi:hypothetical protein
LSTRQFLVGLFVVSIVGFVAEINYYARNRKPLLPLARTSRQIIARHPETGWLLTLAALLYNGLLVWVAVRWPTTSSLALWFACGTPVATLLSSRWRFSGVLRRALKAVQGDMNSSV